MRIALSLSERWLITAAEWNPELRSKYRNNRSIRRPRKRWKDDINEFLKQVEDETESLTESSNQIRECCGVQLRRTHAVRTGFALASFRRQTIRQSRRPRVPHSGPGVSAYCIIGGTITRFPLCRKHEQRSHPQLEFRCRNDTAGCDARAFLDNRWQNILSEDIIKCCLMFLLHEEPVCEQNRA